VDDGNAWGVEVEAKGDAAPHLPPGRYDARVVRGEVLTYRWSRRQASRRLVLTFEVINHPRAGIRVPFTCQMLTTPRSRFRRAWETANGAPAQRRDRMKLAIFRQRLFVIEVGDVTHDRNGAPLAAPYSVVRSILERIA
jgi:hypothetical protein